MSRRFLLFRSSKPATRVAGILLLGTYVASATVRAEDFRGSLQSFLVAHCYDCHADGGGEGGLDLTNAAADLNDDAAFALWQRVHDRVESGEMPPADYDQPSESDRRAFVSVLSGPLAQAHARSKGTVLRRLNRREYQNTINDLFGTHLDLEMMLPEDGRSHEFDNVGSALGLSMVHLQRYLDAIDLVLPDAIESTTTAAEATVTKASYADGREKEFVGKMWKLLDDGAVVFFDDFGYPTGGLRAARPSATGKHKIKVTGYAYQSKRPITFEVSAFTYKNGATNPTFGYFSMPTLQASGGKPTTIELEAWIEEGYMMKLTPWGLNTGSYNIRKSGPNRYTGAGLAILGIELEGPIVDEFPSRGHRLLTDGLGRQEIPPSNPAQATKSWYVPKFQITKTDIDQDIRPALSRVARAAFRRPVPAHEVDRYLDLYRGEVERGSEAEEAYRTAVAAIFCSPDFLYLAESPGRLDDHALAARISYFLTRTAPDRPLMRDADEGRLRSNAEVVGGHAKRLMRDARFERFVVDFTDAWLNLRDIDFTNPDRKLFPEFDPYLRHSMLAETRAFFGTLVRENLPVRNLVQSDFAMLNERLAKHYDIDGVDHHDLRPVKLSADSVRGGLLTQASILKVSANGTNTSPVVRGVWVMERILGQTPPPPPPGIPGVEPDIRGSSTLRELLEKHRDVDSCRRCHQMIDPPGFALECFDPIGGYRQRFRSLGEGIKVSKLVNLKKVQYRLGPPVDASGSLADGRTFADFQQFRRLLADDEDGLARALATKLLTFATGREMGFSDRSAIDQIVRQSRSTDHRIGDLLGWVIASDLFQTK